MARARRRRRRAARTARAPPQAPAVHAHAPHIRTRKEAGLQLSHSRTRPGTHLGHHIMPHTISEYRH
eukprot:2033323-Pleurochrysis_carterae.AAC.1